MCLLSIYARGGDKDMANQDHFYFLKRGVPFWNSWRQANPQIKPDLSKADLSGSQLNSI